jgi:uncharacterized membrane protein
VNTYKLPLLCWITALVGLVLALLVEDGIAEYVALALLCVAPAMIGQRLLRR